MPLQYLLDTNGKTTAVVIPINEWERITQKYQELKNFGKAQETKMDLSELFGKISAQEAERLQKQLQQRRDEWARDT